MQIVNLMTPNPITATPRDTLADAKRAMDTGQFRRLPVIEGGTLVGILTERDIREHIGYLEKTRVEVAMKGSVVTVSPYNTAQDAAVLLLEHKIGGMPVVSSGELVGIVTTSDLLKAFLNQGPSAYAGPGRIVKKPRRQRVSGGKATQSLGSKGNSQSTGGTRE